MSEVLSYAALKESHDRLLADNVAMKGTLTGEKYLDFIKQNNWDPAVKTVNGKFSCFMDPEVDFGSMVYSFAKGMIDTVATPATDAALVAVRAQVWEEAKGLTKSMLATDSTDHLDFLFDGKIQQLREAK